MSSNHKLSGVLQGRAIGNVACADDVCMISFADGATMHVKTAPRVLANAQKTNAEADDAPNANVETAASTRARPANAPSGENATRAGHLIAGAEKVFSEATAFCEIAPRETAPAEIAPASTSSEAKAAPEDASDEAARGVVKGVRQSGTTLDFDLENGQTLSLQTREATSSVLLRDKNGVLEYAD